ncbi:MAG: family 20 glycosylhydrolase [Phycisphaerae bacterium]|nr:family 20 glycosylhydrolase [Phycisphaerae bacterium]
MTARIATLYPRPRRVIPRPGGWLPTDDTIAIPRPAPPELLRAARWVARTLRPIARKPPRIRAVDEARANAPAVLIRIDADRFENEQAYRLTVFPRQIRIDAASAVGAWYAAITLAQWCERTPPRCPCVQIDDAPRLRHRGLMLDISRDKVPTMRTLRQIVDLMASLKLNELQLYTEHTFAYRRHRRVWRDASPMTAAQVRSLDRYCRERFIELVPNQNSLGHMERWLRHPRYAPLAEATGPYRTPWGEVRTKPTTLAPTDPRSLNLLRSLYAELLPNFSSRRFNVGCDEPFELGQGRSRARCDALGLGRVYVDFLRAVHGLLRPHGVRMMFWSDIVAAHPDQIPRLPRDAILLEWGYEADHPFDQRCRRYRRRRLAFYVCPGTSSWCSFAGRTSNALANIRAAAAAAVRHGADGLLLTDWGDFGHRQYWPASIVPLTFAAGMAWDAKANGAVDPADAASRYGFGDVTGRAARLWMDLGDVHEAGGVRLSNRTVLFWCMQAAFDDASALRGLTPAGLRRMDAWLRSLARRMGRDAVRSGCGPLTRRELAATHAVLVHAVRRASAMLAAQRGTNVRREVRALARDIDRIIARHRELWLARNRPGGLRESLANYERLRDEYRRRLRRGERGGRGRSAAR